MSTSDRDAMSAEQRNEQAEGADPRTFKRTQHPSEAGRWYARDGKQVESVLGKNGKQRAPTIRDAREHGFLPSVTSIIRLADRPGLTAWMQRQVVLAALTHPGLTGTDADVDLILADSKAQALKAMELGTIIHAAIQGAYECDRYDVEYAKHVLGARSAITPWAPTANWLAEQSFADVQLGYGGKADLSSPTHVADVKTTDKPLDTLKTWPEHAYQLAAYREGLGLRTARCAIVYVHVVTGEARVIEIPEDELQRGWDCFYCLLAFWKAKNRRLEK